MKNDIITLLENYSKYLIQEVQHESDKEIRNYLIKLESNIQERLEYYENSSEEDIVATDYSNLETEFLTLKVSLSKK